MAYSIVGIFDVSPGSEITRIETGKSGDYQVVLFDIWTNESITVSLTSPNGYILSSMLLFLHKSPTFYHTP